jgi:ABC-type branched-subunit amino acid transport system ATPase component
MLVEQNLPFAIEVCDYIHVLGKGMVVHSSTPKELWEDEEVKARYLGI